jgi:hypothetical protein
MSNLSSGTSALRDNFINEQIFTVINLSLFEKIIKKKTVNQAQLNLKKNAYSLIANLIIN